MAMDRAEASMRMALDLFVMDPPESDFQHGYLCALLVFALEGLGFHPDDPAIKANLRGGKTIDDICKTYSLDLDRSEQR